ncbi:MAG TPA: type II secretion system secretin GspD [Usitatibacteraceae bacterium]
MLALLLTVALAGCAGKSVKPAQTGQEADRVDSASAAPAQTAEAPVPPGTAPAAPAGAALTPGSADNTRIFPGTGMFVKPSTPPPAPAAAAEETFNLNFEAQDIRSLVQSIMGDYLHETFTIHPQTTGTATIRTSRPVPRKDLIPLLEMLLRQNGQIMLREDGIYKIMPATIGTRGAITPQLAGTNPLPNGFSVQMVQLKFVGAKDMQRILEPYASDPQTSVRIDEPRNLIIMNGTQSELRHLLEIVDLFDVDFLLGYSVGLFPMQTDVKALSGDLDRLFGNSAQGSSPLAGIVRIIPIERMNGLLVVTTQPRYLEEARKWIERLDKSGGVAGGLRLNVYPVQHGKAEKLAQLLSDIYGNRGGGGGNPVLAPGQRPAQISSASTGQTTGTPAPSTPPMQTTAAQSPLQALASVAFQGSGISVSQNTRIIADNDNNALLILASPSDYETIRGALRQLDVPRRQVKVEVLIAEVTLTDDLKFGLEWFINARNGTVGTLRNSSTGPFPSVLPAVPGTGGADPRAALVAATPGLQLINVLGGDIRSVLQALGQDGRSQVLSTPNLMVLDNEKGTINVGTKISIDTGETTAVGGNTITTKQYLDTGVILNVTPRINAGGRVTLEVNQEVSSVGVSSGGNPPIDTRKATTVVNVASGETMVLGGLIQNTKTSGSQGVPLLSKIPFIGALFGTQTYSMRRTELVILITPVVINNSDDARAATEELRKKLPALESLLPKGGKSE